VGVLHKLIWLRGRGFAGDSRIEHILTRPLMREEQEVEEDEVAVVAAVE
jgi:hypothetical protein